MAAVGLFVAGAVVALGSDVGAAPRAVSKSNPRERAVALATPPVDPTLTGAARVAIESRCLAVVAAALPVGAGAPRIEAWKRGEFPGRAIAVVSTNVSAGTPLASGYRVTVNDAGSRCKLVAVVVTTNGER